MQGLWESLKSMLTGVGGNTQEKLEEKRGAYRLACHFKAQLRPEGSKAQYDALVTDISTTGARLEASARDPYKLHGKLIMTQVVPRGQPLGGPIPAEVMWSRKIGETGRLYVGLMFHCDLDRLKHTWVGPTLDHLDYYTKAKAAERRKHVRLGSGLEAAVLGGDGTLVSAGKLIDLSGGGCKVEIKAAITSGLPVRVRVGPLGKLAQVEIPGNVVQCREDRENACHVLRVKFTQLEPKVHAALTRYLVTLQREQASI